MQKFALKYLRIKEVNWISRLNLVLVFLTGQGSVQLINLFSGFFLVRWLSVEEYAQYSAAFAFQATAEILLGFGFSGAIVALVGPRIHEKQLIGHYIKAGRFYRNRLLFLVGLACIVFFPVIFLKRGWPVFVTVMLLVSILSSLIKLGDVAYYISPLKMHQKLNDIYSIQLKSSIARLLALCLLAATSLLNPWIAAISSSFAIWYNGNALKAKASLFIDEPKACPPHVRKELFQYIKPVLPGILYAAFSSQISLIIISLWGNSTSIAEVGALGRLGQIFFLLNAASSMIVAPFLAKQSKEFLSRKYVSVIAGAFMLAVVLIYSSLLVPQFYLLLIGDKYAHLQKEVSLLVINASIIFLNVLLWDMNCSRKWLWSWIPFLSIGSNILVQIGLIMHMDLSTTYNVLIFSIILSATNLFNKVIVAIIGLKKNNHEVNLLQAEQ